MVQSKKLVIVTQEQMDLTENRKRRIACYNKWVAGDDSPLAKRMREAQRAGNGRGRGTPKGVIAMMKKIAEMKFETEEQEYQFIGKLGRRPWSSNLEWWVRPGFTASDDAWELWHALMTGYGCYDY